MVSLTLGINRSHLHKEHTLINVVKALGSIISMYSLHVIFFLKIMPRYFAVFPIGH
jgi:hypothetical protein